MALNRFHLLQDKVKREFPRFKVVERNKSWLRVVFAVLRFVTRQDYKGFTTTIGSTMYVGETWAKKSSNSKYKTLRHEMIHVRQFHCWPLGRWAWPINHLLMSLCYLLVLPVFWTMRAKFEREGYTQSLLTEFELYGPFSDVQMEREARWLADTFGGSSYAWMWRKKKAYEWAMETMRKINDGEITNDRDRVDLPRAA